MAKGDMTKEEALKHAKAWIRVNGTQKEFAARHEISQGFLSDVLSGNREPTDAILAGVGLERVITYRKVK